MALLIYLCPATLLDYTINPRTAPSAALCLQCLVDFIAQNTRVCVCVSTPYAAQYSRMSVLKQERRLCSMAGVLITTAQAPLPCVAHQCPLAQNADMPNGWQLSKDMEPRIMQPIRLRKQVG
eukprot:GHRR01015516.1.p1 GENE.GHRR01015516.1~~GHRR01015516.1.p1  ORF type:complete len:122 (-),score=26.92 GHRR01015516.1:513-878(-)